MDGELLIPLTAILSIFVGLPWLIFHYITKWRQAKSIGPDDEQLLDELYATVQRLEARVHTAERLIAAEHDDFTPRVSAGDAPLRVDRDRRD